MKPKSEALDVIRIKLANEIVRVQYEKNLAEVKLVRLYEAADALDFAPAKRRKAKKGPKTVPKQAKAARSRQPKAEAPAEPKKPRKRRSDAGQPRKGKGNGSGAAKAPGPAARAAAEQAGRNRADDGTQVGRDTSEDELTE